VIRPGPAEEFRRFPALVSEGLRTYFLCPLHGWQFDRKTGRCLNEPDDGLAAFPVVIEDGILFADIPHGKAFY
jgi:nitrite reductase/ring-hydroxylating ferredoxin subunit